MSTGSSGVRDRMYYGSRLYLFGAPAELRLCRLRRRRLFLQDRRLVVSHSAYAGFILDALEQAFPDRKPVSGLRR